MKIVYHFSSAGVIVNAALYVFGIDPGLLPITIVAAGFLVEFIHKLIK